MLADPQSTLDRRVPELDGLRGLAVLMVVYGHYIEARLPLTDDALPEILVRFVALSRTGVELFFVLSGFLIGGILLDNKHSSRYFRTFYMRRFLRIIPLYAAVCLLSFSSLKLAVAFDSALFVRIFDTPIPWYAYVLQLQNFWVPVVGNFGGPSLRVTWSLAVEEHFYLTLPLVIWLLRSRPLLLATTLAVAVLATPFFRLLVLDLGPRLSFDGNLAAQVLTPARADQLALGVLGAMAVRNDSVRLFLAKRRLWVAGIAAVCAFDLLMPTLATSSINVGGQRLGTLLPSRLGVFYLCFLLLAVLYRQGLVARFFRIGFLVKAGVIAYGAYILHVPVLHLCYAFVLGRSPGPITEPVNLAIMLLAFVLTLVVSAVSWAYFEKPLVKLGHRYKY